MKNKYLFTQQINTWKDWSKIFHSIEAFTPLVKYIFMKENLPFTQLEKLTPGTNAVFKVGDFIIKIFAPKEAGMDVGTVFDIELYGLRRANLLGIPSPKLVASGSVNDKYSFSYMIMEYLGLPSLGDIETGLSFDEKVSIGKKLREITDKLNTPCENYDPVDIIDNAMKNDGWADYPESFRQERISYVSKMKIDQSKRVYCHGDLNPDNIFAGEGLDLYIIDFADSVYAPCEYEQALIACELFCFGKPYMLGYFGNYDVDEIVDLCATWLPIHDSGEHTLRCNIGPSSEITSLRVMRERLYNLIETEKNLYERGL